MTDRPYVTGFFEEIVGINFGTALLRLDCSITTQDFLGRSAKPSPPTIKFVLDKGVKQLDFTSADTGFFNAGSTQIVRTYFIWFDVIARPTAANYRKELAPLLLPGFTYGDQFTEELDLNTGGFLPPSDFGVPLPTLFGGGADGGFSNLAQCQAYVDAYNAALALHHPTTLTVFDENHVAQGPFAYTPGAVAFVDETNVVQSQSEGIVTASYLFSVASGKHVLQLITGNLQFDGSGGAPSGNVQGFLFNPATGKTLATATGTRIGRDGDFMHSTSSPRVFNFTITADPNPKKPVLIVDGGGGGGSLGGGD